MNFRGLAGSAGLVTAGNAIAAAFGLVLLLILARNLSPAELMLLVSVTVIIDGGQMLLDGTFNWAMVSVAAKQGKVGAQTAPILRAAFYSKIAGGALLALVVSAIAVPLSDALFGDRTLVLPILLAGVAAAFAGVHGFVLGVLQFRGEFGKIAFASTWKNLIRIALVSPFVLSEQPDPGLAAVAVSVGAMVTLAFSALLIPWEFIRDRTSLREPLAALREINGWMALVCLVNMAARLDVWLVGILASPHEAGIFAVAGQLCIGVALVTQAMITTFLPAVSQLSEPSQVRAFLRKWLRFLPILAIAPVLAWPLSDPLIRSLFGDEYSGAASVFNVLLLGSLLTLGCLPAALLLLTGGKARVFALMNAIQVAVKLVLAITLVATFGAMGLAAADAAGRLLVFGLIVALAWRAYAEKHQLAAAEPKRQALTFSSPNLKDHRDGQSTI